MKGDAHINDPEERNAIDMHAHIIPGAHGRYPRLRRTGPRWTTSSPAGARDAGKNFRTSIPATGTLSGAWRTWTAPSSPGDWLPAGLMSYWFTPDDGLEMNRHVNEHPGCVQGPGRFFGLVSVTGPRPRLKGLAISKPPVTWASRRL